MFGIFSTIGCFLRMGPRTFIRQRFKLPLVKFVHDTVDLYKSRTQSGVNNIREILFRGAVIALITALLVWLSIFMYIAFYYVYVPTISHERPVYLKFRVCQQNDNQKGLCSFPSAHVQLTQRQQLLMMGQPYKVHLDLEMPESPTNKELGMFMVCVEFRDINGDLVANSCRSTMLHYKSYLLDTLYKLIFSPFYVFGTAEEKQNLHVELFSDYEERDRQPVTDIFVEIQSTHIEIYSAKFAINARFSGLRYVMFNWPIFSAALGITANLFFIALVCMISWYQIINSEEYINFLNSESKLEKLYDSADESSEPGKETSESNLMIIPTVGLVPIYASFDTYMYGIAKYNDLKSATAYYYKNTLLFNPLKLFSKFRRQKYCKKCKTYNCFEHVKNLANNNNNQ